MLAPKMQTRQLFFGASICALRRSLCIPVLKYGVLLRPCAPNEAINYCPTHGKYHGERCPKCKLKEDIEAGKADYTAKTYGYRMGKFK